MRRGDARPPVAQVKSSRGHSRNIFEMSRGELAFAEREGRRYTVLRVWGTQQVAGGGSGAGRHHQLNPAAAVPARVQAFTDPVRLWQEKKVAVCLLV
jgi:hypothetical protein